MYRSVAVTIVTVLIWSLTLPAAEVPDHLKVQVEKLRQLRERQLAEFETRLTDLQSELKTAPLSRRREFANQISWTKKGIDALKGGALPSAPLNCSKLALGQVGTLSAGDLQVLNVLGPDKMLVIPFRTVSSGGGGVVPLRASGQAIQNALLNTRKEPGEPFMIDGRPTKGIVDGQKLDLPGLFEVTGTEQYETVAGGAKTVFKITWYDADALPYLGKYTDKEPAKADRSAADQTRSVRTWTDASGKFSVKASFAGSAMGKVRLRKEDGSVIEVDLDKLSAADQEHVKGLR